MIKIYKGQSISKGVAEGVALVTKQRLNYTFTEVATGKLLQGGSDVYGEIAKDKILVIPSMVANIDMWKLYWCWKEGTAPKAIVAIEAPSQRGPPGQHRGDQDGSEVEGRWKQGDG